MAHTQEACMACSLDLIGRILRSMRKIEETNAEVIAHLDNIRVDTAEMAAMVEIQRADAIEHIALARITAKSMEDVLDAALQLFGQEEE